MGPNQKRIRVDVAGEVPDLDEGGASVTLAVEGIRSEDVAGVTVEVYLNLPAGEEPAPGGASFVGALDLFDLPDAATQSFDASRIVRSLQAVDEWDGRLEVTFVGRDLIGPTPPPGPWAAVERVTLTHCRKSCA